jgi:hypothetical protein
MPIPCNTRILSIIKSNAKLARAVSLSAFAVEFGPELQIPDSKFQKKAVNDRILNLESA